MEPGKYSSVTNNLTFLKMFEVLSPFFSFVNIYNDLALLVLYRKSSDLASKTAHHFRLCNRIYFVNKCVSIIIPYQHTLYTTSLVHVTPYYPRQSF